MSSSLCDTDACAFHFRRIIFRRLLLRCFFCEWHRLNSVENFLFLRILWQVPTVCVCEKWKRRPKILWRVCHRVASRCMSAIEYVCDSCLASRIWNCFFSASLVCLDAAGLWNSVFYFFHRIHSIVRFCWLPSHRVFWRRSTRRISLTNCQLKDRGESESGYVAFEDLREFIL